MIRRRTKKVLNRAARALRLAAQSLHHSHTALGAKYRRFRRRLSAPEAITAMAHDLARWFTESCASEPNITTKAWNITSADIARLRSNGSKNKPLCQICN